MDTDINEFEPVDELMQHLIDEIYLNTPTMMIMPDGTKEEIDPEGNIGLLAYGYKGIVAWRKKRQEIYGSRIYSPYVVAVNKIKAMNMDADNEQ